MFQNSQLPPTLRTTIESSGVRVLCSRPSSRLERPGRVRNDDAAAAEASKEPLPDPLPSAPSRCSPVAARRFGTGVPEPRRTERNESRIDNRSRRRNGSTMRLSAARTRPTTRLPCRRSWVRVPSSASKGPAIGLSLSVMRCGAREFLPIFRLERLVDEFRGPRRSNSSMAKLTYTAIASLDGYVEDESGAFGWARPDEEVHSFVNDLARRASTHLYGRRMYETMKPWETDPALAGH